MPIPRNIQDQVWHGFEKPEDIPGGLDFRRPLPNQALLWFCGKYNSGLYIYITEYIKNTLRHVTITFTLNLSADT